MSNRTFYASTFVVADGVTRTWPFSFAGVNTGQESGTTPYLYPTDVKVQEIYTDSAGNKQTMQRTGTINSPNQITIDGPAIIAGREIRIYRETELRFPLVDYRDLQSVSEHDLDLANRQAVFLAQETRDTASANLVYDAQGHFNAGGRRIVNLAPGVDERDAVPMSQHNKTLRVADMSLQALPDALQRAGKLLGFDAFGLPQVMFPPTGSALGLEMALRDENDETKGAAKVARSTIHVGHIEVLLRMPRRADLAYVVDSYYADDRRGGGRWIWLSNNTEEPNYWRVLQVPGVATGRFVRVDASHYLTTYDAGVRASNTGIENRLRLTAMYKSLHGRSARIQFPDEDWKMDASTPTIVPADMHNVGGAGTCHPVLELPLQHSSVAAQPDGTFKCYGGVFAGGNPVTQRRYSEANFIYRGTTVWERFKMKNVNNLTAEEGYSLHGIISHGGHLVYIDCEVDDMPNTGIVSTMYRTAHHRQSRCRGNGMLGGGGARNNISNTSTYAIKNATFPVADRTRMLTVIDGEYTGSYEEGVQFANVPFVLIMGNDIRGNHDRAIEGDSAYPQTSKTRENDQIHIYNNDCRGVSGKSNYSVSLTDGFNKDVFMGGNRFGKCTKGVVLANCSAGGSFTFTSRNVFELDDNNLGNGCHALYINAGRVDLLAGATVLGDHDRSAKSASMVSINNDLPTGGRVLVGDFDSTVKFDIGVSARVADRLFVRDVLCDTARHLVHAVIAKATRIDVHDNAGVHGGSTLNLGTSAVYDIPKITLCGNFPDGTAGQYPIGSVEAWAAGAVGLILSSGNYWKGFTYPFGERLTARVGLAVKTSALDLPVAS